jgi:hypothetical protein
VDISVTGSLDKAIKNLVDLGRNLGDKLQFQTLGTVIQTTTCFLTVAANTQDNGQRQLTFSKHQDWKNLMSNINRFFYAHLHTAIELELVEFCKNQNISIQSSQKRRLLEKYEKELKKEVPNDFHSKIESFLHKNAYDRPSTMDILNTALTQIDITNKDKTYFRLFYDALSILRNKSSHSDSALSASEKSRLQQAKLDFLISDEGELHSQAGHYVIISKMTMACLSALDDEFTIDQDK